MPFPSILGRSMAYGSCTSICWLSPGHLIDYSRLIQPGHILELPPEQMAPDLIHWPPGHLMFYWPPSHLIVYSRLRLITAGLLAISWTTAGPPFTAGLLAISLTTAGS